MYVKWFETGMLYYVIIVFKKCHFLKCSNLPPVPAPVRPDVTGTGHRSRMPASAGGDGRGRCRGHIVGAQAKVSEEQMPEQRRMVFPSVARGVTVCGTEMLPRATLGNTAKEV
ncbi:unnamed protein product, partial [Staurois parvus]